MVAAQELYKPNSRAPASEFLSQVLRCLYHVPAIGIKISTLDTFIWSYIDQPRITKSEVKRSNQIKIHKMIRHALEIKSENRIKLRPKLTLKNLMF